MKRIAIIGLCATLVAASIQQSRSSAIAIYVCVVGGMALIGGYIYFKVKGCAPKYYCMTDESGNRFYSNATKAEREASGWRVTGGPYESAEEAAAGCVVTSPALTKMGAISSLIVEDEVYIPQVTMKVWKSTNLVHWVLADTILDDPAHFSWTDTNAIGGASQAFYRVSY